MIDGVLGKVEAACLSFAIVSIGTGVFRSGDCSMDRRSSFEPPLAVLQGILSHIMRSTSRSELACEDASYSLSSLAIGISPCSKVED